MTKKMTKREMFEQLKANYDLSADEVAFIDHELDLLARKNVANGDKKLTATQKENVGIKENILGVMSNELMSITDIVKALGVDITNQKVSALVRQLIADGKVERVEVKRKAYFKLA